jgi:hypothetical protein
MRSGTMILYRFGELRAPQCGALSWHEKLVNSPTYRPAAMLVYACCLGITPNPMEDRGILRYPDPDEVCALTEQQLQDKVIRVFDDEQLELLIPPEMLRVLQVPDDHVSVGIHQVLIRLESTPQEVS